MALTTSRHWPCPANYGQSQSMPCIGPCRGCWSVESGAGRDLAHRDAMAAFAKGFCRRTHTNTWGKGKANKPLTGTLLRFSHLQCCTAGEWSAFLQKNGNAIGILTLMSNGNGHFVLFYKTNRNLFCETFFGSFFRLNKNKFNFLEKHLNLKII